MSPKRDTSHVPALTGFRALAAAMVLFGHVGASYAQRHLWPLKYGWTGVNLFFALSGFLFTVLYFDAFVAGAVSLRDYFLKRAFRVLPLAWALVFVTLATSTPRPLADVVTHLALVHAYFPDYRSTINPAMWTLCVEESFYLVVPALFVGLGAVERARPAASALARLLAVALCLFLLVQAGVTITGDLLSARGALLGSWDDGLWTMTLTGRFSDFACGILAGLVTLRFPESRWWRSPAASTALVALGVATWWASAWWLESHGGAVTAGAHPAYRVVVRLFSAAGAMAILGLSGRSIVTPLFAARPVVYAGRISFALYLSQDAVLGRALLSGWLARYVHRFVHREELALLALYALHSAVAAALFHGLEDPAQRFLRRRFLRPTGAAPPRPS